MNFFCFVFLFSLNFFQVQSSICCSAGFFKKQFQRCSDIIIKGEKPCFVLSVAISTPQPKPEEEFCYCHEKNEECLGVCENFFTSTQLTCPKNLSSLEGTSLKICSNEKKKISSTTINHNANNSLLSSLKPRRHSNLKEAKNLMYRKFLMLLTQKMGVILKESINQTNKLPTNKTKKRNSGQNDITLLPNLLVDSSLNMTLQSTWNDSSVFEDSFFNRQVIGWLISFSELPWMRKTISGNIEKFVIYLILFILLGVVTTLSSVIYHLFRRVKTQKICIEKNKESNLTENEKGKEDNWRTPESESSTGEDRSLKDEEVRNESNQLLCPIVSQEKSETSLCDMSVPSLPATVLFHQPSSPQLSTNTLKSNSQQVTQIQNKTLPSPPESFIFESSHPS